MIDTQKYTELCEDANLNRERHIKEAKSVVVSWEYYDRDYYSLTPMHFERYLYNRGKRIDEEEASSSSFCIAYGFDSTGQLRYIRKMSEEYCLERTGDTVINRHYDTLGIRDIEEVFLSNELPQQHTSLSKFGHLTQETYTYKGSNVTEVYRYSQYPIGETGRLGTREQHYYFTYDEAGKLLSAKEDNTLIYQAFTVEEAAELKQKVYTGLLEETEKAIIRLGEEVKDDQLCFVGIWLHGEPMSIASPIFYGGLQSIRDKHIEDGEEVGLIWSSAEHSDYTEAIENEELKQQFYTLVQYWSYHSGVPKTPEVKLELEDMWWESLALWRSVAMELNKQDWQNRIPATDTFVVFIDEEALMVVNGDLEQCVPPEKIKLLQEKGLL